MPASLMLQTITEIGIDIHVGEADLQNNNRQWQVWARRDCPHDAGALQIIVHLYEVTVHVHRI